MTELEFLKQMPKGKYETYFAPDINNEILTNALNFIVDDSKVKTESVYKDDVLAICVVEPDLKGFHSLIFTKKALYIKLDGFYNRILYSETDSVWIDQETKVLHINSIVIDKYFNTVKFADFLNEFLELVENIENAELQKTQNEILEKLQKGTLTVDDLYSLKNLDFLFAFTDKYGNDALMISYLYDNKTLFNWLTSKISKYSYSHKNIYDFSFLCLAAIQNDKHTVEEYFDCNSYSLLPNNFQKEANSAVKSKKFSSGLDTGFNIAGSILGGIFNLAFGTHDEIISDEDKREQVDKRESEFNGKISNIKEKFYEEYTKNRIESRKNNCLRNIDTFKSQIAEEEKVVPYRIESFKQEKLRELTAPKGEFEKTSDYNKRLADAKKLSENFEKVYSQELKEIMNSGKAHVDAVIESLNQQISSKQDEIKFLDLTLTGIETKSNDEENNENSKIESKNDTEKASETVSNYYVRSVFESLGKYDADTETFNLIMKSGSDNQNYSVHIPIDVAPNFKQQFSKNLIKSEIVFRNGKISEIFWIEYNSKKYPIELEK